MKIGISAVERAFELARSGSVGNVADIKKTLHREGYSTAAIEGRALSQQLREIIRTKRQGLDAEG